MKRGRLVSWRSDVRSAGMEEDHRAVIAAADCLCLVVEYGTSSACRFAARAAQTSALRRSLACASSLPGASELYFLDMTNFMLLRLIAARQKSSRIPRRYDSLLSWQRRASILGISQQSLTRTTHRRWQSQALLPRLDKKMHYSLYRSVTEISSRIATAGMPMRICKSFVGSDVLSACASAWTAQPR